MHQYTVLNVSDYDPTEMLLRHSGGGFHVASALGQVPPFGAQLAGNEPALGFQILVSEVTGAVFRMTFRRVDCDQADLSVG